MWKSLNKIFAFKKFHTKDFDPDPVELIYPKKDYSRCYGYYNLVRSCRHAAMETLSRLK